MTEPPDASPSEIPEPMPAPVLNEVQAARAARAQRLAKALRDNLRRRKAVQPKRDRPGN